MLQVMITSTGNVTERSKTAARNEIKLNTEHRLSHDIKPDRKSFYAYVRSKHKVGNYVELFENNAGKLNIPAGYSMKWHVWK